MRKTLFNQLLTKAGLATDPAFKALLDAQGETVEISEDLFSRVINHITTPEAALSLPSVENHFKGLHFGKTDAKVKEILKIKGYSDDEIGSLLNGKSAEDKIAIGIDAVEKKIAGAGKKDASEREEKLAKAYDELKAAHDGALADAARKYSELEGSFSEFKQNVAFGSRLSKYSLIAIDPELRSEMAIKALRREAQKQGATIVINAAGEPELRSAANPDQLFYPSATPTRALTFDELAPAALEAAGLIDKQARAGGSPAPAPAPRVVDSGAGVDRQSASSFNNLLAGLKEGGLIQ